MRRVPLLRFETRDGQNLQWREVVLDGVRIVETIGTTTLDDQKSFVQQRSGKRHSSEADARAEFEALRTRPLTRWSARRARLALAHLVPARIDLDFTGNAFSEDAVKALRRVLPAAGFDYRRSGLDVDDAE